MDEDIERLVVSVRADTSGLARDVADIRASLDGPLEAGANRAGQAIETSLLRAVRTGKLGFEDLRRSVLAVMDSIAASALRGGIDAILGGAGRGTGIAGLATGLIGAAAGVPGRATGGPVSPGRAYLVGERRPELFVPTASGSIAAGRAEARDVRVAITVQAAAETAPAALARSSRQVARAVRAALMED